MTSPIKVETFDVDITTNGSTHTLTNDVGDISKAFIRINNSTEKSTGGPTGSTGNAAPNLMYCGAELTDTNEITWHKNTSTSVKHVGEVWRFTGSASSFNSFVVRGRFAISASGTSTSQAVSDIVDEDKCVPFITGINSSEGNGSGFDSSFFAAHMDGSGNVVLTSNHSSAAGTVYVTVVEFTGSNWNVGHGVSSSHDSSTETVTLNTDSTGAGGSTFDVEDWTTAWIEGSMGGDTAETGLADCQALIYPHADTDKVYFSVIIGDGAARNDASGYIHVIQNDEIDVNRVSNLNIAEGNGSYGTAAWPASSSTTADIEDLALEWFTTSSGTGTAHGRGRLATRITDATGTITHWVHRSGNTVKVKYGVIDFTNLTSIEHVKKSLDGYCIIDSSNFFKQLDTDSHIKVVDIQKTIEMDSYIIYKFQKDLTSNSFIKKSYRNSSENFLPTGDVFWRMEDWTDSWDSATFTSHNNVVIEAGWKNDGFTFNGTNAGAYGADNSLINTQNTYTRTYSLRFKVNGTTNRQVLFKAGGGTNSEAIWIESDVLYYTAGGSGSHQFTLSTAFTDTSSWHHLWIVYTAGAHKMRLDNVEVDTSTYSTATYIPSRTGDWSVGYSRAGAWMNGTYDGTTGYYFDGQLDEFKIWNETLNDTYASLDYYDGLSSDSYIILKPQKSLDSLLVVASGTSTEQETIDSSSYVLDVLSDMIDSDSYLLASSEDTIDSDSLILTSASDNIESSSYILSEGSEGSIDSDSSILAPSSNTLDSDSFITDIYSNDIDSNLTIVGSGSIQLDSDLFILDTISDVLDSDSYILTSDTNTEDSDSFILTTSSDDLTSSSYILYEGLEGSIETSLYVLVSLEEDLDSDSTIVILSSATIDSNSIIFKAGANDLDSDLVILEYGPWSDDWEYESTPTTSNTLDSDSFIFKSSTTTIDSDSFVLDTLSDTLDSDSVIAESPSVQKTIDSDSVIYAHEEEVWVFRKALNSDISILGSDSDTIDSDLVIRDSYTAYQKTLDSVLVIVEISSVQKTLDSDSIIVIEEEVFVFRKFLDSTSVIAGGTITDDLNSDSYILTSSSDTLDSDTRILAQGSDTIDSDSIILQTNLNTLDSDSVVLDTLSETINSLLVIENPVEGQQHIISQSYIFKVSNESITSDSWISLIPSDTIDSDSFIISTYTTNLTSTLYISRMETDIIDSDGYILATYSTNIGSNSYVFVSGEEGSIVQNSFVLASSSNDLDSTSFIIKSDDDTIPSDSFLLKYGVGVLGCYSFVLSSSQESLQTTSNILSTSLNIIVTDSQILETSATNTYSDSHILRKEQESIGSYLNVFAQMSQTINSDSIINRGQELTPPEIIDVIHAPPPRPHILKVWR